MSYTSLRIHPAIGIARVGNSEEYYLGPESMAGMDVPGKQVSGGLPIMPETEDWTISSLDVRDAGGRLKRQAARFRLYQYLFNDAADAESYPLGRGEEVRIGASVDGKTVKDIVWTVHLANKKANGWQGGAGVAPFEDGRLPALRNPGFGGSDDPADPVRLRTLVIDAGPRAVLASRRDMRHFDAATVPAHGDPAAGAIAELPAYPVSFPAGGDAASNSPCQPIRSLGAITTESSGRLVVLGGYGRAAGFDGDGKFAGDAVLTGDVNNNFWFDDTADGPVTAILVFEDGTARAAEGGAWVISSDPAYAPQTANVVSLWDDLYCTWLERLALQPAVYGGGADQGAYLPAYLPDYLPDFTTDVLPVLRAASLQRWNTSLPDNAIKRHAALGRLQADGLTFPIMNYLRDPNSEAAGGAGTPQMPLSLGDAGKSFLSLTTAQYFFMQQWADDLYRRDGDPRPALGPGEALDKTVLVNCLGGRYSPGIEMGFIVRDVQLYRQGWTRHDGGGPFRINMQALDYGSAVRDRPFLGVGYIPLRSHPVQPGDLCKFMALPWHTDYNSCATHLPSPNPGGMLTEANVDAATSIEGNGIATLLYSSWPAQRPVAVYTYQDVVLNQGQLARPRFSVRGEGTQVYNHAAADDAPARGIDRPAMHIGRYQDRRQFLLNWHRIGVVMQTGAIVREPGVPALPADQYLEVASQFDTDHSNLAEYWRNTVIDRVYPPESGT